HLGPAVLRVRRARAAARGHRRLRARGRRGVLPRRGERGAPDAPPRAAGRHERAPHDRGLLQGLRARPPPGGGRRPRRGGRAVDEGNADVIALIDYGMGNRRSVEKAFEHVGARARFTSDQRDIRAADGLVVPGVGAFPPAMARLRELGLDELVRERAAAGAPVLGICLGFQLLYTRSEEHQDVEGIGLLSGTVTRLAAPGLKIPHIGWNEVTLERPSALTEGFGATASFYHVHSYAARPDDDADV